MGKGQSIQGGLLKNRDDLNTNRCEAPPAPEPAPIPEPATELQNKAGSSKDVKKEAKPASTDNKKKEAKKGDKEKPGAPDQQVQSRFRLLRI